MTGGATVERRGTGIIVNKNWVKRLGQSIVIGRSTILQVDRHVIASIHMPPEEKQSKTSRDDFSTEMAAIEQTVAQLSRQCWTHTMSRSPGSPTWRKRHTGASGRAAISSCASLLLCGDYRFEFSQMETTDDLAEGPLGPLVDGRGGPRPSFAVELARILDLQ